MKSSLLDVPDLPTQMPPDSDLALIPFGLPPTDRVPQLFQHRSTLSPQAIAGEVTTLGWDTTYVLRVGDVNTMLSTSPAVPTTFSWTLDPNVPIKINGAFGTWQIALGGSGGIVFFAIPITQGTLTNGQKTADMAGSTVYISVKLKYIPQAQQGATPLEVTNDLQTDPIDRSEVDPAVVIQNLVFPTGKMPPYMDFLMMQGALQQWFANNIAQFAYIFASINLNALAADGEFQWLQPTYTGYAYLDGLDQDSSYFAMLCMTENRSAEGLSNQIGPGSIPTGAKAGFNIGMQRYVEKVIFPGLVKGFPNATASTFTLETGNTVIRNVSGQTIECDKVKVGAINYTPYVHEFILQVVGDEIQVYTKTVTNISPGIRSVVTNTSYQKIVLVTKPDGSQTLNYEQSRDPETNSWIDKDTGILVTEIIIGIAGAVAGGVASQVIKGVVKIILACVIIAVVFGLAAATPALIAAVAGGGAADALPSIDLLILNATAPVSWPGSSGFTIQSAAMNGAFQLGGDPHIV